MYIKKASTIIADKLEDNSLILSDESTEDIHTLNATASLIFTLCDGCHIDEIFQNFKLNIDLNTLEISESQLNDDFNNIINSMIIKNILLLESEV